jgi:hypothetical protein
MGGKNMTMWELRNCPRCQGDLFIDKDLDGWYEQCLQCGYRREMKPIAEAKKKESSPIAERLPNSGIETPQKRRPARTTTPVRNKRTG